MMIRVERDGNAARILLDRPERANALDRAGVAELRAALAGLDDDVELVVFRGAGGRAFCGGADSRELVALPPDERRAALAAFYDLSIELWEHPALTVAVLDGYATGGGAHVAMACDLRTMAPGAWLQFPSSRYGLHISVVWVTLVAGPATAAWLLASARKTPAGEALELGLVQAVAAGDAAEESLGLRELSGLRELKAAVRGALPPQTAAALRAERERAIELVGLDRFVTALSREPSTGAGRSG